METRKVVALGTLAALPTAFSALSRNPITVARQGASDVRQDVTHARWAWAAGMSKDEAALFGLIGVVECWFVPGIGSMVCGAVGVF